MDFQSLEKEGYNKRNCVLCFTSQCFHHIISAVAESTEITFIEKFSSCTASRCAVNPTAFQLCSIPRCNSEAVLMTKCCIQRIAVLLLKYILFAVVFTSVSPVWQINVVELKYIKSVIKSTADQLQLRGAIARSNYRSTSFWMQLRCKIMKGTLKTHKFYIFQLNRCLAQG